MTYFGFLAAFILFPILALSIVGVWERRKGKSVNDSKIAIAIGIHIILALLYTTPWDNYLVATGVWFYNPRLVSRIVLGYVPIEEYTFFLLETLFMGLWWKLVARRITSRQAFKPTKRLRLWLPWIAAMIWLGSAFIFLNHWKPMTYLSIILFWVIPPMIPQLAFGADILWHQRRLLAWTIVPVGLYLSFADSLAIASGTWTINTVQSTGIFIGKLPLEEGVFFFVTATLISFGMTLLMATESPSRWMEIKKTFKRFSARMSNEQTLHS
jgi:lycopene cyclase domain-containing protein